MPPISYSQISVTQTAVTGQSDAGAAEPVSLQEYFFSSSELLGTLPSVLGNSHQFWQKGKVFFNMLLHCDVQSSNDTVTLFCSFTKLP